MKVVLYIMRSFFPQTYLSIWREGYDHGTRAVKLIDKQLKELKYDFDRKNKETRN
jgi:hypothetical protein